MADSAASFVGRSDELARFRALLVEVPTDRRLRVPWPSRGGVSRSATVSAGRSRVVLVHGLGGSGKTWLMRQFRRMADGTLPGSPVVPGQVRTAWLDWEDEQRERPALYVGAEGPSLLTLLDAVQRAVIGACGSDARGKERAGQAFASYRRGAAQMPQYAARFADVIALSRQAESPFTSQDAAVLLRSLASVGLTAAGHPVGLLGLSPDQIARSAQAAGRLSEAAALAVTGKKSGENPLDEYDLVTDPARELTSRVAAALRVVAAGVPLVVFLDTGELIGGAAWSSMRRVMTQTGSRVAWVIGARFETEAEAGVDSPVAHFVRDIGSAHLALMSPTRFDDLMIVEYLSIRTVGRSYTPDQIERIARFTRGLPLAVSLAAELLDQGQAVEDICEQMHDGLPSRIVSQLARRYLIHAERDDRTPDNPGHDDVEKILGLAVAFGDLRTDPDLLAALWDVPNSLEAFQDLARRHDFVLPTSRRLHDDVRDTLRTDLLDPYRRAAVRDTNRRALRLYNDRLAEMRAKWPTLDQQLEHSSYITALLAALWHSLWLDNQAGLRLLIEILPVLAITDPSAADAAAAIADQFAGTFNDDQLSDLDLVTISQRFEVQP